MEVLKMLRTIDDVRATGERLLLELPQQQFKYGLQVFHSFKLFQQPDSSASPKQPKLSGELSLEEAMSDRSIADDVKKALAGMIEGADHLTARHFSGLTAFKVIKIPHGEKVPHPFPVKISVKAGERVSVVICAHAGSAFDIVEDVAADDGTASLMVSIVLDCGAMVDYSAFSRTGSDGVANVRRKVHGCCDTSMRLNEQIVCEGFAFSRTAGDDDLRHHLSVFAGGKGKVDLFSEVSHGEPHSRSEFRSRAVLAQDAHAIIRSLAHIPPRLNGCVASQKNDTLLLGDRAEIDAIPNLEIGTGDVVASHAASAGPVDEEAVFYLASRGIARSQAETMIATGFLAAGLKDAAPSVRDRFLAEVTERLA